MLLLGLCVLLLGSCKSEGDKPKTETKPTTEVKKTPPKPQPKPAPTVNPAEQLKVDKALIEKYAKDNNLKAKSTPSGLYYVIEKEGKGAHPTATSTVKVHYKGTLLDGTEFDSSYSRGEPTEFPLNRVVRGWQEGIPLLKKGGKGKLLIPSGMAYGPRAVGAKIPANSVLVFDIELLDVK